MSAKVKRIVQYGSVAQVAALLEVSEPRVYQLLKKQRLVSRRKRSGEYEIDLRSVETFKTEREEWLRLHNGCGLARLKPTPAVA